MNAETFKKAGEKVFESEVLKVCEKSGATLQELIDVDVRLLNLKKPILQKYKGRLDKRRKLPDNVEIVAETTGEDSETIIAFLFEDGSSQNKAAERLHKLRGDFPSEKHEHTGTINVTREFTPEDRQFMEKFGDKVISAILEKHRRDIKSKRR